MPTLAVWVPFAKKNLKALKLKTWTMQQDGTFVAKDLPGSPDHTAWLNNFRAYKTALLSLADARGGFLKCPASLRGVHREGEDVFFFCSARSRIFFFCSARRVPNKKKKRPVFFFCLARRARSKKKTAPSVPTTCTQPRTRQ